MRIIITDLTRFNNEDVCTAGINPDTGECIRPYPYLTKKWCEEHNILPGAIVIADFLPKKCTKPHTEDKSYKKLSFYGACTTKEFQSILEKTDSFSIENGFSTQFSEKQKSIPQDQPPNSSIITISVTPNDFKVVPNKFKEGQVSAIFKDKSGREYSFLSITDLGFYNYAMKHLNQNNLYDLNNFIHSQQELYLRVGVGRVWQGAFWLQVNGIYTFPDFYQEIRCYEK